MPKKILITVAVFLLLGACVLGVGSLVEPATGISCIEADSPCPVTRCASGECHGFDNVPESDGIHQMTCPEAGCASVECHAWDSLVGRYHQVSDASLNVWVLAPVALVVGLVALVRLLSRGARDGKQGGGAPGGVVISGDARGGAQGAGRNTKSGNDSRAAGKDGSR